MCLDILKNLGIDVIDNNNHFKNILLKLNKNSDAIKFLMSLNIDDCRILQEILYNEDEDFLTAADIIDLEKCVEFMNNIKGPKKDYKQITDRDLIMKAIELYKKNPNLEFTFNNYVDHLGAIKDFKKNQKLQNRKLHIFAKIRFLNYQILKKIISLDNIKIILKIKIQLKMKQ